MKTDNINIRKAETGETQAVVDFIDSTFTKEGYGFVTSAQIESEIKNGRVFVAVDDSSILGVRIGKDRVYNLAVHPDHRTKGIGRKLIDVWKPETIRVKASPHGHLSKKQRDNFKSPRKFYEKVGFKFSHFDFARNFWQKTKDKALFHKQGKVKHIEIYENVDPKQRKLF